MVTWSLWLCLDPFAVRMLSWFWHQKWDKSALCVLVKLRFSSVDQLRPFAQCGPPLLKQVNDSLRDFCSQRPGFTMKAPLFYFERQVRSVYMKKKRNEVSRLRCKSKGVQKWHKLILHVLFYATNAEHISCTLMKATYCCSVAQSLKSSASWVKDVRLVYKTFWGAVQF